MPYVDDGNTSYLHGLPMWWIGLVLFIFLYSYMKEKHFWVKKNQKYREKRVF